MSHAPFSPKYQPTDNRMQPTVTGVNENGELIWSMVPKAPWHLNMFPVGYQGQFFEKWTRLALAEAGYDDFEMEGQ